MDVRRKRNCGLAVAGCAYILFGHLVHWLDRNLPDAFARGVPWTWYQFVASVILLLFVCAPVTCWLWNRLLVPRLGVERIDYGQALAIVIFFGSVRLLVSFL